MPPKTGKGYKKIGKTIMKGGRKLTGKVRKGKAKMIAPSKGTVKTGAQRMKEQKETGLRKTRKKPSGRAKKTEAHVDNVRGATVRRARAPAHFPIDQEDVRIRRLRHQNSTHEKARQEKPHVTIASGKHRVRNPMATFHNEFDPAILAGPTGGRVHARGRSRFGKNSMPSAANELNPAIRGGGGSDVARGPYGKISGLA